MPDGSGPGFALIIALALALVLLLASVGLVVVRRKPRPPVEAPPEEPVAPVEAPPEAEVPPVEVAPVAVEAPPVEEAPAEAQPEEAAPSVEEAAPPVVEAPPRRRVRGIGGALKRLFRGGAMSPEEREELEEVLLRADVGVAATTRIVESLGARDDAGVEALRAALLDVLGSADRSLRAKPDGLTVWLITGVNGVGKTTTIGKLSAQLAREGKSVLLAAADTFRAAADEQLQRWADRTGAEVVKHAPGADPAAVVFDGVKAARARGAAVLIVDTAGRLHTKKNLMDELGKINRVLEREAGPPDEVLLVLDATTGQNGLQQAKVFAEVAPVSGLVLTKLDGTAKGGIVVGVQQELGIPVKLVGLGEGIDDLAPFDPTSFVDDLLSVESAVS